MPQWGISSKGTLGANSSPHGGSPASGPFSSTQTHRHKLTRTHNPKRKQQKKRWKEMERENEERDSERTREKKTAFTSIKSFRVAVRWTRTEMEIQIHVQAVLVSKFVPLGYLLHAFFLDPFFSGCVQIHVLSRPHDWSSIAAPSKLKTSLEGAAFKGKKVNLHYQSPTFSINTWTLTMKQRFPPPDFTGQATCSRTSYRVSRLLQMCPCFGHS